MRVIFISRDNNRHTKSSLSCKVKITEASDTRQHTLSSPMHSTVQRQIRYLKVDKLYDFYRSPVNEVLYDVRKSDSKIYYRHLVYSFVQFTFYVSFLSH